MSFTNHLVAVLSAIIFLGALLPPGAWAQSPIAPPRSLGGVSETDSVTAVAFSPNGKILADGRSFGHVNELNSPPNPKNKSITVMGWTFAGPVRIWDTASGKRLRLLPHAGGAVNALAF